MNISNVNSYWFRVFVALSILVNAILGGELYESLCARWWRLHKQYPDSTFINGIIWAMDRIEKNHCKIAYVYAKKINKKKGN